MTAAPLYGFDLFGEEVKRAPQAPLAERFLVPPFSVLNAREGGWQERKEAWLSLGIKSEVGRGANLLKFSKQANSLMRPGGALAYEQRRLGLPEAAPPEVEEPIEEEGGTSIFDPVLCELAYRWFCPERGQVIDPFAGGSVRGVVAALLGRAYWGCDLRAEQIEANRAQGALLCASGPMPEWVAGDAMEQLAEAPAADFLFSCPPYGDLEVYSQDPRDLSAMPADQFFETYRTIIARAALRLKPDSFACFVVGDYRDERGVYRNFPGKTVAAFKQAGLDFYNEAILLTAIGSLPIRVGRNFEGSRKLGKTHQNVLIFVKGDGKRATQRCKAQGEPEA